MPKQGGTLPSTRAIELAGSETIRHRDPRPTRTRAGHRPVVTWPRPWRCRRRFRRTAPGRSMRRKAALGHSFGAAGAIRIRADGISHCADGLVPPDAQFHRHPIPASTRTSWQGSRRKRLTTATPSTPSFGFGGHNVAVRLRQVLSLGSQENSAGPPHRAWRPFGCWGLGRTRAWRAVIRSESDRGLGGQPKFLARVAGWSASPPGPSRRV